MVKEERHWISVFQILAGSAAVPSRIRPPGSVAQWENYLLSYNELSIT